MVANRYPEIDLKIRDANIASPIEGRNILIIGQKTSAGTAASGELKEDIKYETEFDSFFGKTSQLAKGGRDLLNKLFKISAKRPKISAIGLSENASGVVATGSVVFTGTATASGVIYIYIDSNVNKYTVEVLKDETAAQVGAKLKALIDADTYSRVSAINATGTVTLASIAKGAIGNSIGLAYKGEAAGISVAITGFTGGSTEDGLNPSLTGLFDVIDGQRYTSIVFPSEWNNATLIELLDNRYNVFNKIMDGVAVIFGNNTFANYTAKLDAINSKNIWFNSCNIVNKSNKKCGAIFENSFSIACILAGLRDLVYTPDSEISSISNNPRNKGGYTVYPYHNLIALGLPIIETGEDYTEQEKAIIVQKKGNLLENNGSKTALVLGKAQTSIKTNQSGVVETFANKLTNLDRISLIREFIFNNLKNDYKGFNLTNGELVAGVYMVNSDSFIGKMNSYYNILSDTPYALVVKSFESSKKFEDRIKQTILLDMQAGSITAEGILSIISNLENILIDLISAI